MKTFHLLFTAPLAAATICIPADGDNPLREVLPACSLHCITIAATAKTNCSLNDGACLCERANYRSIYRSAYQCVTDSCGTDNANLTVVPAVEAFCAPLTAPQEPLNPLEDILPACSVQCISTAIKNSTACALDDGACLCARANYRTIYREAYQCVTDSCGLEAANATVVPAVDAFCTPYRQPPNPLQGVVPDCSLSCITNSIQNRTTCSLDDGACLCSRTNYRNIYRDTYQCVTDACGGTEAANSTVVPAVEAYCAPYTEPPQPPNPLHGLIPDCSLPCITNAIHNRTTCSLDDGACLCNRTNYRRIYRGAYQCVTDACGGTEAANVTVVPAVEAYCAPYREEPQQPTNPLDGIVPACSVDCISNAAANSTTCSLDDGACLCASTNYRSIYRGAYQCVIDACGGAESAEATVVPAVETYCAQFPTASGCSTPPINPTTSPPTTTTPPTNPTANPSASPQSSSTAKPSACIPPKDKGPNGGNNDHGNNSGNHGHNNNNNGHGSNGGNGNNGHGNGGQGVGGRWRY